MADHTQAASNGGAADGPERAPAWSNPQDARQAASRGPEPRQRPVRFGGEASCSGCRRRWGLGTNAAHCATCHRHFGSVTAFDKHRTGGQCTDPQTLRRKDGTSLLVLRKKASGLTWVFYRPPGEIPPSWHNSADEEDDA